MQFAFGSGYYNALRCLEATLQPIRTYIIVHTQNYCKQRSVAAFLYQIENKVTDLCLSKN